MPGKKLQEHEDAGDVEQQDLADGHPPPHGHNNDDNTQLNDDNHNHDNPTPKPAHAIHLRSALRGRKKKREYQ